MGRRCRRLRKEAVINCRDAGGDGNQRIQLRFWFFHEKGSQIIVISWAGKKGLQLRFPISNQYILSLEDAQPPPVQLLKSGCDLGSVTVLNICFLASIYFSYRH